MRRALAEPHNPQSPPFHVQPTYSPAQDTSQALLSPRPHTLPLIPPPGSNPSYPARGSIFSRPPYVHTQLHISPPDFAAPSHTPHRTFPPDPLPVLRNPSLLPCHTAPLPPNPFIPQALMFPPYIQTPIPSKHQSPCILPQAAIPSKPYFVPISSADPNAPIPHKTPQTPHSPLVRNHNSTASLQAPPFPISSIPHTDPISPHATITPHSPPGPTPARFPSRPQSHFPLPL